MNNNIYPCIWYNGNAREAAAFYCTVFPHSKIMADTPMVVNFELYGQKFMGLNGGPQYKTNPSISFFIICETDEEINELYAKLMDGAIPMMPLGAYPWSDRYAFLQDKFGLSWQLMKGNYNDVNQKITPSFLFVGNHFKKAEAAVKFYTDIFPQSSIDGLLLYTKEEGQAAGAVKHSQFSISKKVFMAMDGPGEHTFAFNEAVSLVVECKNQEEIDYYWNSLTADGGAESMCGWLKDKFGVSWQIVPVVLETLMSNPEKASKVMEAFMKMKKFNIAALEAASN
jgi:predicted 3-demethylubiquinone-9 3-methyltransferase (glyoxalase superfamily)